MRRIRQHLTYANVVATIALFIAISGGTAVALNGTNTVFTDDIADDTRPASGGNPAGGLQAADLRANSVGSSEVTNGSLASGDLAAAARGARAYGRVAANGNLSRSKNVASVSHSSGFASYCITPAAGINPASAVLLVAPDMTDGTTGVPTQVGVAQWRSVSTGACPATAMEVDTFTYNGDQTDNVVGASDLPGDSLDGDEVPFAFVIP